MASFHITQFRDLVTRAKYASDPEVKVALTRIANEAKRKLGEASSNSAEFFDSLRHSLSLLRGSGNADLRIACLLNCANYFYVSGESAQGIASATDAVTLSRRVRDDHQLRKSQTILGILLADAGSIAEAIEWHVSAAEIAERIGDEVGYASSLVNLGIAFLYASQFDDAIACQTRAESLANHLPGRDLMLAHISANKALCYLNQNKIGQGLDAARQSIELAHSESANDLLSRIVREFNYVQLLLEAGDNKTASERVCLIKLYAQRANTARATILSKLSEGLVEICRGDASIGLELLLQAEREAAAASVLHQDALIALVKGYEHLGRYQNALVSMQELMDEVKKKRRELADWLVGQGMRVGRHRAPFAKSDVVKSLEHREALLRARVAENRLIWSQIEMLERLAVTADLREEASGAHGYRVGRLSATIGEELKWSPEDCLAIDLAARLHDIGKIGVPDRILLTSQELKDAERHFMCTHTLIGAELLAKSNIAQLRMAEDIALCHHEWWDGTGYPNKLSGKRIPIHARIVALADVFDALTHGRPYSPPWSIDRAIEELRNRRGSQFDPDLTDLFLVLIAQLREKHADLDEFLGRASRNSPFLQARQKIKLMLAKERENEREATIAGNETRH